jgi:hypothetical protein
MVHAPERHRPVMPVELTPDRCPFCGATPITRLLKVRRDQLHGEPLQDWMVACPKGHAQMKGTVKHLVFEEWNRRIIP